MQQINKVAVLGAGVMGATIAAHLANAGLRTLLLDIVPPEPNEAEKAAGLGLGDRAVRDRFAASGLEGLKKAKPAAFFLPSYANLVEIGNFEDDIGRLKECDWVIEVVVENMAIKKKLFSEKVAPNLKPDAVLSTNTSGLSVNELSQCLPEALRKRFLVTHFFNPPRYMRLLEIVPCKDTDPALTARMGDFIQKRLGKGIVWAKDTPNFVANRIGVYSIASCVRTMMEMDMTVEEVDAVAGSATARPKSAAFRTVDLVGIDTMRHVGNNSYDLLVNDEERALFKLPPFLDDMVAKGILGNKSKGGFYKKVKSDDGSESFLFYDWKTGEYKPSTRPKFASVEAVKQVDDPGARLKAVVSGSDKAALFAWRNLRDSLLYTWRRIPEIADDIVNIDNAMKWGFNWDLGPFEMFDAIGVADFAARAEAEGVAVPATLKEIKSFYRFEGARRQYWCLASKCYKDLPGREDQISLAAVTRAGKTVEKNAGAAVHDRGGGVVCREFHPKANAHGNEIRAVVHRAL